MRLEPSWSWIMAHNALVGYGYNHTPLHGKLILCIIKDIHLTSRLEHGPFILIAILSIVSCLHYIKKPIAKHSRAHA